MVYTVERFVSRLDQLTPHKLDAREKLLAARGVERRDICARDLYTQIRLRRIRRTHRPPCARHPAQTAQSNALVTAYRESRDRGVRMSVRVHTHMCLSIGHVSLSQFSERLSRAGTRRISLKNTAAERQGIAIGVSVREQTAERLQREQTIYALLYRGRAALTPLGPIPLEALEERGPRVCAALLAAHRARRLARAGGDALGVARHHRVELLGGASE